MASQTLLISSFVFDGLAITSKSLGTIDETADFTFGSADSSRTLNAPYADNKSVTVTIESTDPRLASSSKFRVGATGTLVMKGKLRTVGDGLSTETTITCQNAMCQGQNTSLQNTGESSLSITFVVYDPNADDTTNASLITYS